MERLFYELVREPARTKINMHDLMSLNAILFTLTSYFRISLLLYSYDCVVPENIHTPPRKVTGNSEGEGGSKAEISEGSGGFIGSSFSRG